MRGAVESAPANGPIPPVRNPLDLTRPFELVEQLTDSLDDRRPAPNYHSRTGEIVSEDLRRCARRVTYKQGNKFQLRRNHLSAPQRGKHFAVVRHAHRFLKYGCSRRVRGGMFPTSRSLQARIRLTPSATAPSVEGKVPSDLRPSDPSSPRCACAIRKKKG